MNIMNISSISTLSFKSNPERERELMELRELKRLRQKRMQEETKADLNRVMYPDLDNQISTKAAGFFSKFTCAIQNASEHNVMEFFADDKTAADLRKHLSPECQKDSKLLREEIKSMEEFTDPVMTLICANRMKRFVPKEGILSKEQQTNLVEGIKNMISAIIRNSNLEKFEPEDKAVILELVQKIENSETVDFGIGTKLKILVDRLNSKKFKTGFIPPVTVRNLDSGKIKQILK